MALGSVAASQAYAFLTGVTTTTLRGESAALDELRDRMRINATGEERIGYTISRLTRNLDDITSTLDRTRGLPRGSLVDIQA